MANLAAKMSVHSTLQEEWSDEEEEEEDDDDNDENSEEDDTRLNSSNNINQKNRASTKIYHNRRAPHKR